MHTKLFLALLGVLALAVVAGCGDDDDSGGTTTAGNAMDAAFITDMTTHHQGAIDMARIAKKRADHPEIEQLADDIVKAQTGEIAVMKRIRDDLHHMGLHSSGHMGMSDAEMGMDMDISMLEDANPFDREFIDMMVPHHEGAIAMAKQQLAKGRNPALRRMARDIIDAQTDEIAEMRRWRKEWFGSAAGASSGHAHGES